jgi:hypothetical protein
VQVLLGTGGVGEAYRARDTPLNVAKDGVYFLAPEASGKTLLQFHKFATERLTLGTIEKRVWYYLDVSNRWPPAALYAIGPAG